MAHISALPKTDPRYDFAMKVAETYRDPFKHMAPEELARYQGRIVAILDQTGQIIADAPTITELEQAVLKTEFAKAHWSHRTAPSAKRE